MRPIDEIDARFGHFYTPNLFLNKVSGFCIVSRSINLFLKETFYVACFGSVFGSGAAWIYAC